MAGNPVIPTFVSRVTQIQFYSKSTLRISRRTRRCPGASVETAESRRTRGFRVISYGTDTSPLRQNLRDGLVRLAAGEIDIRHRAVGATAATSPCICFSLRAPENAPLRLRILPCPLGLGTPTVVAMSIRSLSFLAVVDVLVATKSGVGRI